MFGIGPFELLIVLLVAAVSIGIPIFIFVWLWLTPRSGASAWGSGSGMATPTGTPVQIRALSGSDKPIAESAVWEGGELVVRAHEWSSKSLFDVPLANLDGCMLTYCFRIKADDLRASVYPELWCRVPEKGQFFSRGIDRKVRGNVTWTDIEIPFYLEKGQHADLLHLNLVFEGAGTVRLANIAVFATPTK